MFVAYRVISLRPRKGNAKFCSNDGQFPARSGRMAYFLTAYIQELPRGGCAKLLLDVIAVR